MSENSTLLQELDTEASEFISGGQRRPRVFYACPRDRYVTNADGYYWFRGRRGCQEVPYDDAPRRVRREVENFRGNFD
ncbi:hypothetical protein NIES2109_29360 [Nostoc sp. HK-01]|uniref:Uncharacterized protein n=1 Tax=Nostoc cycadae WK-1 TaxID=1861711 RepID=A0A2H6LMR1_9NOSO|nr:hypothetical protein [Nostoc cycadae]BBD60141.1 hypothetical protein NIES2109_29360 [Nostoc sp. HK-01]GBE94494.1 hypothetical protein NCWK1_4270 [Nostoc cycadae WK-1]